MSLSQTVDSAERIAVIYCRVSNSKQKTEHDGLRSQATRCREYADYRNCQVVEVFEDDMSGGKVSRPGMDAMLAFLRRQRRHTPYVIIDDLSRLARGIQAHWELRELITKFGGELISPSIEFGTDSDSKLIENIRASVAQHQREKNAEQTKDRMRARVQNGYWVFWAPRGLKFKKSRGQGSVLVRDEPLASIIAEGMEGYASRRFETQVELKRFLESKPEFPKDYKSGEIRNQRVKDMLTQPLYAGYIALPSWGISLRKAQHEGLVSFATYERIQQRLTESARAPVKSNLTEDFPLRAFAGCGDCGHPLTACWSKSKSGKKHPYYQCYNKECSSCRKSIRRDDIEADFEKLLQRLTPSPQLIAIARKGFKMIWDHQIEGFAETAKAMRVEAQKVEKQIAGYLDRILDATSPSVIQAYEKRINELELNKTALLEKAEQSAQPPKSFEQAFRTPLAFLSNPIILWNSNDLCQRRLLMKMAFSSRPLYKRGEGFRTPDLALPFKALDHFCGSEREMARRGRFELPTPRFVV
ncbi:Recombinase [Oceanicaulis sp. 350]|nr:Recombinase [Oceanicaulis sp. 350]